MSGSAGCGATYREGEHGLRVTGAKHNRGTTGGPAATGPAREIQSTRRTIFLCHQDQLTTVPAHRRPAKTTFGCPVTGNTLTVITDGEAAIGAYRRVTGFGSQLATCTRHKVICRSTVTGITCRQIAVSCSRPSLFTIRFTFNQTTCIGRVTRWPMPPPCC